MSRFLLAFLSIACLSFAQTLPTFNWAQQLENSGADTLTGIATDALGNIYLAGTTLSPYFPVKNAFQSILGTAGIFKIDASGYSRVGTHTVVSALAADPLNANVFYAISVFTGVKSIDGGNTWTTMTMPSSRLVQFVVDPSNDQTVYAAGSDVGFMKSTDAGATWNVIATGITVPQSFPQLALWIDPNTRAVFGKVAGDSGTAIYRSTDAGASWQTIRTAGVSVNTNLYFDTTNPGVLYLFNGGSSLQSTDDGSTFQPVTLPVGSIFADPNMKGRLLGNSGVGIFESDDDGATWTLQNPNANIAVPDWANGVLYGFPTNSETGMVQISSDLKTITPVGPAVVNPRNLVVSGGHLYLAGSGVASAFVTKLDSSGNIVYSTYLGGSGGSNVAAIVVDAAGNAYVTGGAGSFDFPTTKGAYSTTSGGSFVAKFKPDGSLGYSTFFPETVTALAVDSSGAATITGRTDGSLPVTPGAYVNSCPFCGSFVSFPGIKIYTDVFLTKFDPTGSTLIYSTYLDVANGNPLALALGSDGSSYVASYSTIPNPTGSSYLTSYSTIYHLNATGSSMLGTSAPLLDAAALAVGPDGSVYAAGSTAGTTFSATAGAFQSTGPAAALPNQPTTGTGIVKLDAQLKNILAATWFGGSYPITLRAMTIDASGDVYVAGGTAPHGLPARTPLFEAFGPVRGTGFLSELSGDLSKLLYSTYLGDADIFSISGVALGASGTVIVGGSTTSPANVWVNSVTTAAPPALRIDSILNAASAVDGPIAPGETIYVRGAGFGTDSQLIIGGAVVPALAITPTQITAVVPSNLASAVPVQVQSGGATTNIVPVPTAATSPGIFSADGSGSGQGYIFNQDGTLNGPTHPAKIGDQITIFATGVGPVTSTGGSAVTGFAPNVMIDGYNCDGSIQQVAGVTCSPVAATFGPVTGFPGSVYTVTMIIPYPAGYHVPPSSIVLNVNGAVSQNGLSIYIVNN